MQINSTTQLSEISPAARQSIVRTPFVEKTDAVALAENENVVSENEFARADDLHKLRDSLAEHDITLNFRQDEETGRLIVELVNNVTGEAIRQIPSEVSLELSRMSVKMQGQFVDETV